MKTLDFVDLENTSGGKELTQEDLRTICGATMAVIGGFIGFGLGAATAGLGTLAFELIFGGSWWAFSDFVCDQV